MTSEIVYHDQKGMIAWAEDKIAHCKFREDARAIGHERDGKLIAVVVYDTFSTSSCFVHLAADGRKWNTPEFAMTVMAYPFRQCGFHRINCIVSATNRLSLIFTRHFGWKQEGVLREGGPEGEDMILFGMLRRECKYGW
jgi:RimJ/RimL family protein N-acetyltransferase